MGARDASASTSARASPSIQVPEYESIDRQSHISSDTKASPYGCFNGTRIFLIRTNPPNSCRLGE
jgi:hypothetical protein